MNVNRKSISIRAKGQNNTSLLEGRYLQRIQIIQPANRKRQSSPAFLKYSTNSIASLLALLAIAYLVVLFSFFGINANHERTGGNRASKNNDNGRRPTIGVASTVTGCGDDSFIDGAAVLKYNLDLHSQRPESKFNYHSYVFYHPSAKECVLPLKDLGYTLLERPTPIKVEEIRGDGELAERMVKNGCCGEVRRRSNSLERLWLFVVLPCLVLFCSVLFWIISVLDT